MALDNHILFNVYGPRTPSDIRGQLFPFSMGKMKTIVPGSESVIYANAMDAGKAGAAFHFKIDPCGKAHYVNSSHKDKAGIFGLMVNLSGAMDLRFDGANGSALSCPERVTFFTSGEDFMSSSISPNTPLEFASFIIPTEFIRNMLDGERAPEILRKALGNGDFPGSSLGQTPSTPAMKRIARDVALHPYHGPAEKLYLQGKILELLAEAASTGPDCRKTQTGPRAAAREKVAEAVDILSANPENPPTPEHLAQSLGVGYKTLNRGFAKYFGETVFQYTRRMALDHAKKTLDESGLTVAEVAFRYGFCNPSAFIAAYRRRFGQTPGTIKKKGKS